MEKIRYGIVGIGNQGTFYSNFLSNGEIEHGVLSAVCDINDEKLKIAKEKFPCATPFKDYKEMVGSGLCDAIIITTPHYLHPEIAIYCLDRGMNVICDKPAGVYTKQVKEMNEAARRSKAKFAMMFNQRTNCVYRKMRELVSSGEIGQLQRVNWIITDWYRTQSYYDGGNWRATWSGEGGGVLINQCPHQIDLVQWVVGKMPTTVRGFCKYGRWHDIEVEDEVTAYFEYDNGATGVFITTTGEAPGTNRFMISGTKGQLLCENDKLYLYKNDVDSQELSKTSEHGFMPPKCERTEVETDGNNPQHKGILENFSKALLGLEEQFVQGTDGINGVELMNAIELSGWKNGEAVTLPVDEEEYIKELKRHCDESVVKKSGKERIEDTAGTFGSKAK